MSAGHDVVGRERELDELDAFLHRPDPLPAALLLEGSPGIGKTALWRAALKAVRGRRVVRCAPAQSEAQHPFGAAGDLLVTVDAAVLDSLPEPQRRALGSSVLRERDDAGTDPRTLGLGFLGVLLALVRECPLVVAVDDCQWVDPSSATLLAFAVRRLEREPVTLLLTRRGMGEAAPFELDRALDPRRMTVGPLSLGGTHRLLRRRFGHPFPRPLLRRVHEASGGTPLYAIEIARGLESYEPGAPLAMPSSLGDAIRDRITAQPADVRRALAVAAAAARPTTYLVGDDAALDQAVAAGLVALEGERVRFTHPLLASEAYAGAGAEGRRDVHRRLARTTHDPDERARHLGLAATGPDEEVAAAVERAGERAAARGAGEEAADLVQLSLRLTPADAEEDASRRRLRSADLLLRVGDKPGASALMADGSSPAEMLRRLASYDGEDDLALARQVLDAAADDPGVRAAAHKFRAESLFSAGSVDAAREEMGASVAAARLAGDPVGLAEALGDLGIYDTVAGAPPTDAWWDEAIELERRTGSSTLYGPALANGLRLMWLDRVDESRESLFEVHARARAAGNHEHRASVLLHLTELECRAGRFREALRHAITMIDLSGHSDSDQSRGAVLFGLALAEAYLGRVDDAADHAREGIAIAETVGDRIFWIQNHVVLGFVALSTGDAAAAARILPSLWDEVEASGYRDPSIYPILPNAIEALAATGSLVAARLRADALLERGRELDHPWALALGTRCDGVVLECEGEAERARERFEAAIALHERVPSPFERARTLMALGRVHRRAKRRGLARDALEEAAALFERTGAALWETRARDELARVSGRARAGGGELTATEQRIAELVGEGRSNKEVAGVLYVSVRTVEANLTRVYAKLGVRNRAELARLRAG